MSGFRQRLQQGDVLLGQMVLEFFTPGIGPMLAACDLDFVIFDMEHGRCDIDLLAEMIASCRGSNIVPLARVPDIEFAPLSRALGSRRSRGHGAASRDQASRPKRLSANSAMLRKVSAESLSASRTIFIARAPLSSSPRPMRRPPSSFCWKRQRRLRTWKRSSQYPAWMLPGWVTTISPCRWAFPRSSIILASSPRWMHWCLPAGDTA